MGALIKLALKLAKKAFKRKKVGSCKTSCPKKKVKKCPRCGRAAHDTSYPRNLKERKKALLRDAKDPNSGLSDKARQHILKTKGESVPPGYEVSHERPLYTVPPSRRCTLDKASNMKTQKKADHRRRHKRCGDQFHQFPRKK